MTELTPAEQMLYTTVRVTTFAKGQETGTGTAFFYRVAVDADRASVLLVSNKHVFVGADEIRALFHVAVSPTEPKPSGNVASFTIQTAPEALLQHPDPDIDLCAININASMRQAREAGHPIFLVALDRSIIPGSDAWGEFDAIEEVTMVGCPRGIFDAANNIPIVRRGITATPLSKRYNGEDQFVVDMACFPGSSGSPIFVYNRDGYLDRKNNTYMMGATRFFFVGVLFAGPIISNSGQVILGQPASVQIATMMHLGYALRSSQLLKLEEQLLLAIKAKASGSGPS